MAKRSRRLIFLVGAVVGIVLYLVAALFSTETGSAWFIHRLASYVTENLTIKNVRGNLFSGLSLHEVNHDTNQLKTRIEHIELNWRPLSLLRGKLHITQLQMKGVSLFLPSSVETFPMDPARLPDKISMPVSIFLDDARLEAVDIHRGKKLYELKHLNLTVRADKDGIRFENFKAYGQGTRLSFKGHSGLQQPFPFEGNIDWNTMTPGGLPIKGKCSIEGNVQGGKATFRLGPPFVLETAVELKANKEWTKFSVIGNHKDGRQSIPFETPDLGGTKNVYFNQLEFQTLGGSVTVHGNVNWQSEPVLDLSIRGENINPDVLLPDWPGKLKFQSRLKGRISDETTYVSLSDIKVLGSLIDQRFALSGSLKFQDNQPEWVDLDIRAGNNRLKLSGASDKSSDLQFDLEVLEPESLWPGLRGPWRGKGSVKRIGSSPAGVLVLEGNDVSYGNFNVESYHGSFACDSIDTQKCSARVEFTNLVVDGDVFPSLSLDWNGDLKNHRVRADLATPTARVNLEFTGECHSDTWEFRIETATFDLENNGIWRLNKNPVNVLVDHTGIKPFNACWAQKGSSVCVDSSWSAGAGWKSEGDLNAPPLNRMIDILKALIQRPKLDKKFYKTKDINYR
jgi:autotransporter translocation and assembly factor TamB